jgi:hypothetical protein
MNGEAAFLVRAAEMRKSRSLMQDITQQIMMYFQQISALFPEIPASALIFFLVVAGFLALAIVFLILRLLGSLLGAIFGFKRRRRARGADPAWERQMRLRALRQQHHWQREDW